MLLVGALAYGVFAEYMELHIIIGAFIAGRFFHPKMVDVELIIAGIALEAGLFLQSTTPDPIVQGLIRQHIRVIVRTPNGNDYGKDLLRQHLEVHPN